MNTYGRLDYLDGIDTNVRMPEPAHVAANRAAARHLEGRAMGGGNMKFDNDRYKASHGYRRFGPGYSRRGEKAARLSGPMPLLSRKLWGTKGAARIPNASAPSADMRAMLEDWRMANPNRPVHK